MYSFGIVLLQLITSRPTSIVVVDGNNRRSISIADWVRDVLAESGSGSQHRQGDISSVIDPSIRGGHCDLVDVRKVAELALRCAEREDFHARPTMTEVVAELEALALQQQRDDGPASGAGTSGSSSSAMAEDDEPVAGSHEVVQLAEAHSDAA